MQTQTCSRCGGTGEYSYNLRDGRRCYGCEGKGIVLAKVKGIKGVKPTSQMQYAEAGDICKVAGVGMVKVVEVLEGDFIRKERDMLGEICERHYPQIVRYESLIDGKVYRNYRYVPKTEQMLGGRLCRVNKLTNVWFQVAE